MERIGHREDGAYRAATADPRLGARRTAEGRGDPLRHGDFEPLDLKPLAFNADLRGLVTDIHRARVTAPTTTDEKEEDMMGRRLEDTVTLELEDVVAWLRNTYRPAQGITACRPFHTVVCLQ